MASSTAHGLDSPYIVQVAIEFLKDDNILQCDKKGKRKVRGTMSTIRTYLPYPAPADFRPSYSVFQLNLQKSKY